MQENTNNTRKILINETSRIVAVATIVVTVLTFVFQMKQDIALIKQKITTIEENGFSHIVKSLDEMDERNNKQDEAIKEIREKLNGHLSDFGVHSN